jgi:ABC-2 type transport system ATP-binding protein
MLTSVLRPTSGSASVAGFDVVAQPQAVRASVGVLTEQHGLYGRMSALEYLDFYGQIYRMPPSLRRSRTDELLAQFGLSGDARRKIGEYSKGMRQKLALARALYHDPPVLLMDEPTSAMDPESARLVRDAIHGLRSANRAIIICTHNLAEAEELAGKIAIIQRGRIVIDGEVEQLKTRLLGIPLFEVQVSSPIDGALGALPEGVELIDHGPGWLRYRTSKPMEMNPLVVQSLVKDHIGVLSLSEVTRSLEAIYLQAINPEQHNGKNDHP